MTIVAYYSVPLSRNRPVISHDFSWFQYFFTNLPLSQHFLKSGHQGKKEVASIVSKPVVSCLWGCGESVNLPKLNIQEDQGVMSSRPKGRTVPLPISQVFFTFIKSYPWCLDCLLARLLDLLAWLGHRNSTWCDTMWEPHYTLKLTGWIWAMWRVCKSSQIKHPGGSGGYVLWILSNHTTEDAFSFVVFILTRN